MQVRRISPVPALALTLALLGVSQAVALPFSDQFTSLDCDPACNAVASPGPANEVHIAVSPANPNILIATAKDYSLSNGFTDACTTYRVWGGMYRSSDGGKTWTQGYIPGHNITGHPLSPYACVSDPVVAFDRTGTAYFSGITVGPFGTSDPSSFHQFLMRSLDGGATWQFRGFVDYCSDKQWITLDPVSRRVYAMWADVCTPEYVRLPNVGNVGPLGMAMKVAFSDDGGATWSTRPAVLPTNTTRSNQGAYPAVGPLGQLYVTWRDIPTGVLFFGASADAGQSFFVTPIAVCLSCQVDFGLYALVFGGNQNEGPRGYRVATMPTMAVDRSLGPNHGSIYIAYTDFDNSRGEVKVVMSRTGGFDWSPPVLVMDQVNTGSIGDALAASTDEFYPAIDVGPNGDVHVAYYSTRNGVGFGPQGGEYIDAYYSHSPDGLIWDPAIRLSAQSFDPWYGHHQSGFRFIGDYIGISASADKAHAVWADTRSGQSAVMTAVVKRVA